MVFDAIDAVLLLGSPFVGSFLALVIFRLPRGEGIITPRSHCPSCKTALKPLDLVPVLSWVFLRGKCRHCGEPISALYPLVELAAIGVAIWAFWEMDGSVQIITTLLGWWLLTLAMIDYRKLILPDVLTLPLIPLGLVAIYFLNPDGIMNALIGMAVGFLTMLGIRVIYKALMGREGIGLGDVKLMAAAGAWVGWIGLAGVLLWASLGGILFAILRAILGKNITAKTMIPFGAFLCLGLWLTWVYGPVIFS